MHSSCLNSGQDYMVFSTKHSLVCKVPCLFFFNAHWYKCNKSQAGSISKFHKQKEKIFTYEVYSIEGGCKEQVVLSMWWSCSVVPQAIKL